VIDFDKRKEQRFLFLRRLYDLTEGSELRRLQISEVSEPLEISRQEANDICRYLKGQGLAKPANMAISINQSCWY